MAACARRTSISTRRRCECRSSIRNPNLFSKAKKSNIMVSHVDFLPTIANLFQAPDGARGAWQGVDYSKAVLNPKSKGVQSYTVFTFDDFQGGQASGPYVP